MQHERQSCRFDVPLLASIRHPSEARLTPPRRPGAGPSIIRLQRRPSRRNNRGPEQAQRSRPPATPGLPHTRKKSARTNSRAPAPPLGPIACTEVGTYARFHRFRTLLPRTLFKRGPARLCVLNLQLCDTNTWLHSDQRLASGARGQALNGYGGRAARDVTPMIDCCPFRVCDRPAGAADSRMSEVPRRHLG